MAGIWHFLPGISQEQLCDRSHAINREILDRFGLAKVLRDVRRHPDDAVVTPLRQGPGGQAGTLLYPVTPRADLPANPAYDEAAQSFTQRGERWLGWLKDEPIKPMALERRRLINGYFVNDRFGKQWAMATLRGRDNDFGALPVEFCFGDTAWPTTRIAADYQELWQDGKKVWDHLQGVAEQSAQWLASVVARVLAINYRLGIDELWLLGNLGQNPFDTDFILEAINALTDFGATAEYAEQKKRLMSLIRLDG